MVEDGKFKGLGFVENGYLTEGVLADGNLGIAQGISRAVGLDLVDHFLELQGQVLGEGAGFLPGQDVRQIFRGCERTMGIMLAAGRYAKTLVEFGDELG